MEALKIAIAAINRETIAIIGQRYRFAGRQHVSTSGRLFGGGIVTGRIFVEIIAEVERAIEVARFHRMRIRIEPAEADIGTREDGHLPPCRAPFWQRACAAKIRHGSVGRNEAEVIPATGFEIGSPGLAAVIIVRGSSHRSFRNHAAIGVGFQHLPRHRRILRCRISRPEKNAIAARLATRDTMREPCRCSAGLRRQWSRCKSRTEDATFQKGPAIERWQASGFRRCGQRHVFLLCARHDRSAWQLRDR